MKTYGIKIKKPKLKNVKMPKVNEPKIPKLRFGSKKSNFGRGNDYYTKIFKS